MNDEQTDDSALTRELLDSLTDLAVPGRPSLAAITGRGRAHQRRRRARFAGLSVTGAAASVALALGLTGVFGAAPAPSTTRSAGFTLISYYNGAVSLNMMETFDPGLLQRALKDNGIPALVKSNVYCSSSPAVPASVTAGVFEAPGSARHHRRATPGPDGQGILLTVNIPVKPSQLAPMDDPLTVLIYPPGMPSGTELFIGYYDLGHTIFIDVIRTGSHTCVNGKPPAVIRLDRPPSSGH
jgi:hypothetical protein